jgi:N-acetylmuramoyl-L-alanine amidase
MFYLIIRLLSVICLAILSAGLQAQPARPSPLKLTKLSHLQIGQELQSTTSTIKPPLFVQNFSIVIDPGHGGHDIGTQSISKPRYQEKSLNLVTAKFVRDFLQQLGYQVVMTREEDKFVSLEKRTMIANQHKPTLFVSIHYNSAPLAEAQGIEVFFYQSKEKKQRTLKSKRLAQIVLKNIITETQAKSRGIKQGSFVVIRQTTMPAILVEGGFVTNEAELQNLKDPTYLKRLAWGIVRGIEEYLSKLN